MIRSILLSFALLVSSCTTIPVAAQEKYVVGSSYTTQAWCKAKDDGTPHADWEIVKTAMIDDDYQMYLGILSNPKSGCIKLPRGQGNKGTITSIGERVTAGNGECLVLLGFKSDSGENQFSWTYCHKVD